ncbi:MAG: cation transporter [Oscillospiraceae bacterium]|nr:cation transporter [Oscillospiraceae bacterium]
MTKTYRLTGLCCANCAARMERLIEKIDTVEEVTLNFMTTKLIVEMDENAVEQTEEIIMAAIAKVSKEVVMTRA